LAVIKCAYNHFYDDGKFGVCPHCAKEKRGGANFDDEKTVAKAKVSRNIAMDELTQFFGFGGGADEKTVSVFKKRMGADPVVGWLVCCVGAEKGRDYRLHSGRNFIGRADKMDIAVKDDDTISREDHCSIVFEPKACSFLLVPGHGTVTFLNGERLDGAEELTDGAEIEIGASKFIFIPYCGRDRKW